MTERPVLSLEELEAFDPHAPQGAQRRFCCPLCGPGKARDSAHRSLSVEISTGLWRCFRCEAGGKLREKWQEKPLQRRARVRDGLHEAFGLPAPAPALSLGTPLAALPALKESKTTSGSPRLLQTPSSGFKRPWRESLRELRPLDGSPGQHYLEGRGLSLDVCLSAKVKFCPSWLGRPAVVFPIYDDQDALVAAQGRYTDGRDDPKARTLGSKKSGVFLTGGFWKQVRKGAPVIVTEAPIDALSLAACGFPALSLCGKSGWPQWLPIRCAFKEVMLCLDGDAAGEDGAAKLSPVFESLGAKVRRVAPEATKDWNEMLARRGTHQMEEWLCARLLSA